MKKEVLIADDHAIIRDGLRKIIDDTDDLCVAGEASNGNDVLSKVRERAWGLLVLDLSMPGRHALELVKLIKTERSTVPILIFSMHPEEQYAVRAIHAGASGYLSKEGDSDLILPAMRKVAAGGIFISQKVAELLATNAFKHTDRPLHDSLSDREYEVFCRIVRGVSLTNIAQDLSLSIKTVSTHKSNILGKLGLNGNVDLIRYAIDNKLLDTTRE